MSRFTGLALAVLIALGASACGSSTGADLQPLTNRLEAVDAAAVAADDAQLETAVVRLLHAVDDAESAGEVGSAHADRIRRAAETLLEAAVPPERRSATDSPTTSTTSPPPPGAADDDHEDERPSGPGTGSPPGGPPGPGKAKGHGKGHTMRN